MRVTTAFKRLLRLAGDTVADVAVHPGRVVVLRRLVRIDWDTTWRIIERVMVDGLDPDRPDNLFVVGVDEVSWRKATPT